MVWQPIEPLTEADRAVYVGDADALRDMFGASRAEAEAHHVDISKLLERLKREWAIETGILERLYDIDRGTTNLLIERGFIADLMVRQPGQRSPDEIRAMLNDHHDGIEIVYQWVSRKSPLSLFEIRSLHQVLTRNQDTVDGIDASGRLVHVQLESGQWKKQPNSPTKQDGNVHEYCPPEQTQPEMEQLLKLFEEQDQVHPLILGAWLHHRFAQIHPFQDGNGRVARCLMNFVLIRGGFLPVVIGRDDRTKYLDALEAADDGSLEPLVRLLANLLTARMAKLLAQVSELKLGVTPPKAGKAITAEEAAERLAAKWRANAVEKEPESNTKWRAQILRQLETVTLSTVDAANRRFVAAGFKARITSVKRTPDKQNNVQRLILWMPPDSRELVVALLPIAGQDNLMDAIALVSERGQRVVEDPDGHLLLASSEPMAETTRRIAKFIDQRVGAWLAGLE